jgi:hypothetical protein
MQIVCDSTENTLGMQPAISDSSKETEEMIHWNTGF